MKPFYDTTEMIDVDLYADALVAIYRFSHATAIDTIFPSCIAPERSDAVKTCVMKACLTIVTEVNSHTYDELRPRMLTSLDHPQTGKIGGQPPISSLFPVIATRSRQIIRVSQTTIKPTSLYSTISHDPRLL